MHLYAFDTDGGPVVVVTDDDGLLPEAESAAAAAPLGRALPGPVVAGDAAKQAVERGRPLAPLRPGKIVAVGLNYLDHVEEAGTEAPARPLLFAKFPSSVIGPDAEIVVDRRVTERVDWEVELGVVIGRTLRDVPAGDALGHVFGYTAGNDVSARDVQFGDGQWVRGKSLDTFCPLGPRIVTADAIPDPQRLRLTTKVNGEVVQDSSTAKMIFDVAEILAFCSRSFTLEPGDLVLTGTPWGCGEFMDPKRSLRDGDVVEVSVEGVGALRNPVREVHAG
ncbi:MAG TPA: fumarylacetoacetate hydrolase family protein [Gaiellaceae bacterium]|nr:fumarylacetoacetate hydrolase family protein [Gaiellaceae bacterium]